MEGNKFCSSKSLKLPTVPGTPDLSIYLETHTYITIAGTPTLKSADSKSILCRILNCPKEFSFLTSFSRQRGKGRGRQLTVSCAVCKCVCACTREQRVRDRELISTKAQRSHLFPQQIIHKFYSQVGHRTFI